jgi:hypothetical protein
MRTRPSRSPARRSTVMPSSWLCRPRRWIACSVRDLRRRGRHSPRPIVGGEVARDRDRDAEGGGMAVVGIHIRRTLHLPRRWDSRAVCLRRARRWGQREAPRRLRLKPPVRARGMVGLCRPREPESPAPQGNPRPHRHNDEVGMTVVMPTSALRRFVVSSLELPCGCTFAGGQEITDGCVPRALGRNAGRAGDPTSSATVRIASRNSAYSRIGGQIFVTHRGRRAQERSRTA